MKFKIMELKKTYFFDTTGTKTNAKCQCKFFFEVFSIQSTYVPLGVQTLVHKLKFGIRKFGIINA